MDNVGDWLYLFSLDYRCRQWLIQFERQRRRVALIYWGNLDREIVPNDQPTEGKRLLGDIGGYAKGNAKT